MHRFVQFTDHAFKNKFDGLGPDVHCKLQPPKGQDEKQIDIN